MSQITSLDPSFELDPFWMQNYLQLVETILRVGEDTDDRTGFGTRTVSTPDILSFNVRAQLPVFPYKTMPLKGTVDELLWFLRGDTDPSTLRADIQRWWTPFLREGQSDLGPIYGAQWRAAPSPRGPVDQLHEVLMSLWRHAHEGHASRRHVVSLWGVGQQEEMALPCWHGTVIQFFIRRPTLPEEATSEPLLDCTMYQRSADVMVGLPVNILSYGVLVQLMAKLLNIRPGKLRIVLGDAHIYQNHMDAARGLQELARQERIRLRREHIGRYALTRPWLALPWDRELVWPNVEEPPRMEALGCHNVSIVDSDNVLSTNKLALALNV